LHTYDEIAAETENAAELVRLMSIPPAWGPDFPVFVEGWCYPRYTKSPPPGVKKVSGLNGEVR